MFAGMTEGWFTGKLLADYFSATKDDPRNARRIINGTDKASTIAGYHAEFLDALEKAAEAASFAENDLAPQVDGEGIMAKGQKPASGTQSDVLTTEPCGFWAALISALAGLFKPR